MHAILTPVGSAGDVNPFVMIGCELRRRGHRVTLMATEVFADIARGAGLEFVAVGSVEEYERATSNPDLWDPRRGPAIVFGIVAAQLRRAYAALEQVYEPGQTMLVGHSLSFPTRVFEEARQTAAATVHLSPSVFRSDYRQAAMPSGGDISAWPRWAKRAVWWGIDRFAIDPLIAPALNQWRAELGLTPVSRIFKSWLHSPQRVIGLFPAWFGDPQPDWPPQTRLTGFVTSDESCSPRGDEAGQDAALHAFLESGAPPIVFTPGTANHHASEFFRVAVESSATIGRRALLVTRHRDHLPARLPAHAHHVPYAPFAVLFPRAAAVVHHGGIGTCAQALAAGVPQLIMAMGFDQPDNALRISRLGAGEATTPSRFTGERVAAALRGLLSPAVQEACVRWRAAVHPAAGLQSACDLIEAQFEIHGSRRVKAQK